MRKFAYRKLVRDLVLEGIKQDGRQASWKTLDDDEYRKELVKKLVEESKELENESSKNEVVKELADIQEIVKALAKSYKITNEEINLEQNSKNMKSGSFNSKIFVDTVEVQEDNTKWLNYYLSNPEKYPEIK